MTPKHKSSDAGHLGMPERSRKERLLSEKVKVVNLLRKEELTVCWGCWSL